MLKGLSILAAAAAWFGRCGDGSVISDATGADTAPTHMASKLCDPLRSEWAYLSLDAEEATPLRMPTARVAPGGDPAEPAVYEAPMRQAEEAMRRGLVQVGCARRVSAHSTLMVWTDENTVRLTYLDPSVYVLFLQRDAFEVRTLPNPTDAFFYAPPPNQWKTYACEGRDTLTVDLTTNAVTPRQVSTDSSHIVFADVAAAGGPWDVFAYARTASHPLRWKEVEVKAEALTPLPGSAALHRLHPVVCGGRMMYLEVRTAGGAAGGGEEQVLQSTVISVDLESGETVRHGSGSSSLMYALTAWPVSHSSRECAFAWAEAAGNATKLVLRTTAAEAWEAPHLALNVSAAAAVAASSAAAGAPVVGGAPSLFASRVVVETFPDRAMRRLLVAADGAASPATELVQTLAGGGPYLFVKKAEVEKISAYKIENIEGYSYAASAGAATTTRSSATTGSGVSVSNDAALETVAVDVHSKTRELEGHRLLLRLHSSMDAAVVYQLAYLRTDGRAEPAAVNFPALFLSRLHVERALRSELPEKLQRYTCVFPRAYDPEFTAAYHDLVVTRIRGEAVLSRVDLDKDNDGLHDRQDRFPLHSKLTWDGDNDGHADEDDIVGWIPCDDSPLDEVNTCASDLTVMYSIWAIFTFLLIVVSMSLGWYRNRLLREGIVVESLLDEEDLVLLGEEGSEGESEGGWFRDLRLLYTIRDHISLFQAAEAVVQHFLLLLTLASVVLVIVPVWNKTHMRGSTLSVFEWVDLFTASVFAIDLIFRWVFREDESMTFLQFFRENWFDFPSLVCDLPGATNSPTLNALVAVRLLRMMRVLKVFRVMRFYRKLTNQSAYVSLVVNHSQWLIPIIAVLLLVTVAMVLKIVEQQDQSEFESYWNCLWFCFVTATTVGYGDMTPIHWVGRVLACVLMFCGIGMIGNVTARVSEKISQTGYQRAQERERKERHEEHPAIRLALLEISVAFNPLVALRDKRKEPVDPLSLKYMTPRYRDVAVMQSNERILRDLEAPADTPVASGHVDLESRGGTSGGRGSGVLKSEVVSTRSASLAESGSSFASSSSNPGIAEVRVLWKGKGHYGGIVKLAFLRAAALERLGGGLHTVYVPPKELAKALREDGDIKRLQRMVTTVELSALNETIQVLEQAKYQTKIITWELFEKELIQTQEYHYAVARDMLLKRQQLEGNWTRFNDKHMVQKLKRFRDQRDDPIPKCRDKLYLLLLRYKLDETYKGVRDFDKLYMRLNSLIFRRAKKNQLIIEKVFSVGCFEEGVGEQEDDPEELENMYDWQDPLEDVFEEIEVVLRQHNVHAVEGFVEILFAIESIAMQFDRLECTRWALHHLEWGRADRVVIVPRPPLATDKGTTNIINPLLHIPKPQRCPHSDLQGECREYLVYTKPEPGATGGARGRPDASGPTSPEGDGGADADSDGEDGFHAMGDTVAVLPADSGGLSLARNATAPVATSLGHLRRLSDQHPVCHGHRCTTQRHVLGVAVAGGGGGGGGEGDADVTKDPRGHFVCPNGHLHLCVDCVREPKRGGGVGGTLGEGGDATASRTWRSNASQQSSATATTGGGGGSRKGSVGVCGKKEKITRRFFLIRAKKCTKHKINNTQPRRYSCRFDEAETMRLDVINRSSSYRRREGESEAVDKKPSTDFPAIEIEEVVSSSSDSAASYQGGLGKREPTMEELDPPSSDEVSDSLSALQNSMKDADGNPLAPPPPREKRAKKVKKTSKELEVDPACLI